MILLSRASWRKVRNRFASGADLGGGSAIPAPAETPPMPARTLTRAIALAGGFVVSPPPPSAPMAGGVPGTPYRSPSSPGVPGTPYRSPSSPGFGRHHAYHLPLAGGVASGCGRAPASGASPSASSSSTSTGAKRGSPRSPPRGRVFDGRVRADDQVGCDPPGVVSTEGGT
jgi:hypothetical protein